MRKYILATTALAGFLGAITALAQDFDYRLTLDGLNRSQRNSVKDQLMLMTLRENPPQTRAALDRLTALDRDTIIKILQAEGYFAADVQVEVDDTRSPAQVTLMVKPGKAYTLADVNIIWQGVNTDIAKQVVKRGKNENDVAFPLDETVTPETLEKAITTLLTALRQNGFLNPQVAQRKLVVDHSKRQVTLDLSLNPGRKATFGKTTFDGADDVDHDFILRRIDWEEGDGYDVRRVNRTQKDLINTGVIGSVQLKTNETATSATEATIDSHLALTETLPRSIGAGAYISSDIGPYGQLFWENRNIWGSGERLRLNADFGTERYGIGANLRQPDIFNRRDLALETNFKHLFEDLEAYESYTTNIGANVIWYSTDRLTLTGGSTLEYTEIRTPDRVTDTFTLVSFPVSALYDSTNDLLDPQEGYRLGVRAIPTQSMETDLSFLTTEYFGSIYLPLGERFVWANRAKIANIQGANTDEIPADKRLYAGGGGSVRGYGYQLLGPRDADDNPTGGRFLTEVGTEIRYRFSDTIGLVSFIDGGQVTETSDPTQPNGSFRWSFGVGARYHTVIGPIRFDVAVPLDKERGDDAFQFYISIGQAF